MAAQTTGSLLGFAAGAVWGVAFFSWGLPLPIPARIIVTALLVLALSVASRPGLLAAGAFSLGMGASSASLLASGGLLFEPWGLVPATALLVGVGLHAAAWPPFGTRRG